jgi:hypothetical protein
MKKYKLLENTKIHVRNIFLCRIEALRGFGTIKKGERGGFIESEKNLSHEGNSWVTGDAKVYGNSWVFGDAKVSGNAEVYGNAYIYGHARVYGNAKVYGKAMVYGNAKVYGNSYVCGNAYLYIYGNVEIFRNIEVSGNTWITENNKKCVCGKKFLDKEKEIEYYKSHVEKEKNYLLYHKNCIHAGKLIRKLKGWKI